MKRVLISIIVGCWVVGAIPVQAQVWEDDVRVVEPIINKASPPPVPVRVDKNEILPGPAKPDLRHTDGVVHRDLVGYEAAQGRIKAQNDRGIRVANYYLSKAQCWLDTSFHEYNRRDQSGYPEEAYAESMKIVMALEKDANPNPGIYTPFLGDADELRIDLWNRLANLKAHRGFECAAQKIACAEVELVHAGSRNNRSGWRNAKPYIQIAEDLTTEAQRAAEHCIPEVAPQPAPVVAVAPQPAPPPKKVLRREIVKLESDALFAFDKSDTGDMLPQGIQKINDMVEKISTGYVQVDSLKFYGYTDRLGSDEYNMGLSQRRANTVMNFVRQNLLRRGAKLPSMSATGYGESNPVKMCPGGDKRTPALINCLQPNRRVEIEISGY